MYGDFHFLESCIDSDAKSIDEMTDQANEISKEVFFYNLNNDKDTQVCGFKIAEIRTLYGFSFYESVYKGESCFYMENSRIEYIFTVR